MKKLTKKQVATLITSKVVKPGTVAYGWNNQASDIFNQLGDYETSRDAYEVAREAFNNVPWNATKAERIEAIINAVNRIAA